MAKKDIHIQRPKFRYEPLILCAADEKIRYKASSGGVVSAIIRYLFEEGRIQNAVSYEFDKYEWFKPKLINSYEEYHIVGSIYHDVELIKFVKDNATDMKGRILVTCLPCQVKAVRKILEENKIESFIVALTCSAQMSKEATHFLFNKFGIEEKDIEFFRYRGNGWPSGVQIKTRTNKYFFHNIKSIWIDIFHSQLFTLKRCFSCKDTFGLEADMSVADPWLERYTTTEHIGATLVVAHTDKGNGLIQEALQSGTLKLKENISQFEAVKSQDWTLKKKYIFRKHRVLLSPILKIIRSEPYISIISSFNLIRIHTRIFYKIIWVLLKLDWRK